MGGPRHARWERDLATGEVAWSGGLADLFGYSPVDVRPTFDWFAERVHPEDATRLIPAIQAALAGTELSWSADYRFRCADGTFVPVSDHGQIVRDSAGRPVRTFGSLTAGTCASCGTAGAVDAVTRAESELRRANEAARASERRLATIFRASPAGLAVLRLSDDRILDANERFLRLLGRPREEVIGRAPLELLITANPGGHRARLLTLSTGAPAAEWQTTLRTRAGELRDVLCSSDTIESDGEPCALVSLFDITERKKAERALERMALHDELTGLPNRALFFDRLRQAIRTGHRGPAPFAVLLMDLNDFKCVNDTLGHLAGDALLRQVGQRVGAALRGVDTAARVGGDEFGAILAGADAAAAGLTAGRILHAVARPVSLEGGSIEAEASIGIALYPEHGDEADTLLGRADAALYAAKRSGARYVVSALADDPRRDDHITLLAELRSGIDRGELVVHYQPEVRLASGRVTAVEALVRWRHPRRGLLLPEAFIPHIERSSLRQALTRSVLETSLEQASRWTEAGRDIVVAVNVFAHSLVDLQLPDAVEDLLERYRVRPDHLCLEITETTLISDPDRAAEILGRLHRLGVRISFDDFGTGQSSLLHLRQLPVDQIKIDRSFVRDLRSDRRAAAIVRGVVQLAHALGFEVVAEGVEDRAAYDELVAIGCDAAQGYFISRPLPGDEIVLLSPILP